MFILSYNYLTLHTISKCPGYFCPASWYTSDSGDFFYLVQVKVLFVALTCKQLIPQVIIFLYTSYCMSTPTLTLSCIFSHGGCVRLLYFFGWSQGIFTVWLPLGLHPVAIDTKASCIRIRIFCFLNDLLI